MIHLKFFLFVIIFSVVKAYFEVQIEGKNGWARNLPTWRIKNKITHFLMCGRALTGYHVGLWTFEALFLLLFPMFIIPNWQWYYLLAGLSIWFLDGGLEDYLWSYFNKIKFDKKHLKWFKYWVGIGSFKFPAIFFVNWIVGGLLYYLYWYFSFN